MANFKPFKGQSYEVIKRQHNDKNLFTDDKFPPTPKSLSHTGRQFFDLQWRRPKDIVRDPQFVINDYHRGDIDQGRLGNCWFLAGAAALTLHPDLLERVVPRGQSFDRHSYAGIFHFRFWLNGEWCDVVIDDNLPCTSQGSLVFCQNRHQDDKNEMWSALLEKAFAKVCGSYEAMTSGLAVEAMIAMSGGIGQTFALHHENLDMRRFSDKQELKRLIQEACEYDSMIACAIDTKRGRAHNPIGETENVLANGLVTGHAYSITGIAEARVRAGPVTIIRCSNPWGNNKEWNGAFSDKSSIWDEVSNTERKELKLKERDDGEFWISFNDFFQNFDDLYICYRKPVSRNTNEMSEWNAVTFHGKWVRGKTAAGCGNDDNSRFFNNPQYLIEIDSNGNHQENCTVLVALLQKDFRQHRLRGTEPLCIGFSIFKVNNERDVQRGTQQGNYKFNRKQVTRVDESGSYVNSIEVTKHFSVPPGTYVLIPSTFEPDQEGDFLLRVFTELTIIRQEDDPEEEDSLMSRNYENHNDGNDDDDDDNSNYSDGSSTITRSVVLGGPFQIYYK